MKRRRLILAALLACAVSPGVFIRSELLPPNLDGPVSIRAIDFPRMDTGPFSLTGAWELDSANNYFGGYSALVPWGDDKLLAASDAGRLLVIPRPDLSDAAPAVRSFPGFARADKMLADVESLTIDRASGQLWAGLEWSQMIARFRPDLSYDSNIRPLSMADWGGNSGPESLTRLPDGRFLVIEERPLQDRPGTHEALLFPSDPLDGAEPLRFSVEGRVGFRPSDALALDDGRLLVLMRSFSFGIPPRFGTRIIIADTDRIEAGQLLRTRTLANFEDPLPTENFEGMALVPDPQGGMALWLISDDNKLRHQRTLLLKLHWNDKAGNQGPERQKARE